MAELRAFGVAGGAAGIHLDGAMIARDRMAGSPGLLRGEPFGIVRAKIGCPPSSAMMLAHRFQTRRHLLDQRIEIGADEQQFGAWRR